MHNFSALYSTNDNDVNRVKASFTTFVYMVAKLETQLTYAY